MTLDELNRVSTTEFTAAIGWVFEHSPWVAERASAQRPFPSIDALHQAMAEAVRQATRDEQLVLLRAHPDLGTRARISPASEAEQSGAGLAQLTEYEFQQLAAWNAEYKARFGFPFLYAVTGSTKHDILAALEARRNSDPETEFRVALEQVYRIARIRLNTAITAQ